MGGGPYGDWLCGISRPQTMSGTFVTASERSASCDVMQVFDCLQTQALRVVMSVSSLNTLNSIY